MCIRDRRDISLSAPAEEWRPTFLFDDVQNLRCDGLHSTSALNGEPMVQLENVTGAWLSGAKAPKGARSLLKTQSSRDVLVTGCDIRGCGALAEGEGDQVRAEYNIAGS